MKAKVKLNLGDIDITLFSIVVMLCCLNITYLNTLAGGLVKSFYYLRILMITGILFYNFYRKYRYSMTFKWFSLFFFLIIGSSVINNLSLGYILEVFTRPYLLGLYFESFSKKAYRILKAWCSIFWILVFIDAATMIYAPLGLYADSLYSNNWFLGYKTMRLVYSLPLCVFTAYLSEKKHGKFGLKSYFAIIISTACLFYSEATSASIGLLLLGLLFVFFDFYEKLHFNIRAIYNIFNYKVIIPVYAVVVMCVLVLANNSIIQFFVVNVLHKSITLSYRTYIWNWCLKMFMNKPFFGCGYLTSASYLLSNVKGATNAHNMVLSILVTVGIVGMLVYIFMFISCIRQSRRYTNIEIILIFGIIIQLFVGITSSTIVFSTTGFIFYNVLSIRESRK